MKNKPCLPLLGLLLLCALAMIVEARFKVLQHSYDDFVLDNRNHYLPCKDLPPKDETAKIIRQHSDLIQQIQEVAPGSVGFEMDASTCEGKADMLFWYGTHEQRLAIEKIIGGKTFFGIPYRLQNR
jgi:hypothetical protein